MRLYYTRCCVCPNAVNNAKKASNSIWSIGIQLVDMASICKGAIHSVVIDWYNYAVNPATAPNPIVFGDYMYVGPPTRRKQHKGSPSSLTPAPK
jgi:hypothetical protein